MPRLAVARRMRGTACALPKPPPPPPGAKKSTSTVAPRGGRVVPPTLGGPSQVRLMRVLRTSPSMNHGSSPLSRDGTGISAFWPSPKMNGVSCAYMVALTKPLNVSLPLFEVSTGTTGGGGGVGLGAGSSGGGGSPGGGPPGKGSPGGGVCACTRAGTSNKSGATSEEIQRTELRTVLVICRLLA